MIRNTILNFTIVFLGGGLGSLGRYLVYLGMSYANFSISSHKAFATISVNIIGCFLIAIANGLLNKHNINIIFNSEQMHLFFITGFLGGFTTYSSFVLDIFSYTDSHSLLIAFLYLMSSIFFGLTAFFIGSYLIKLI